MDTLTPGHLSAVEDDSIAVRTAKRRRLKKTSASSTPILSRPSRATVESPLARSLSASSSRNSHHASSSLYYTASEFELGGPDDSPSRESSFFTADSSERIITDDAWSDHSTANRGFRHRSETPRATLSSQPSLSSNKSLVLPPTPTLSVPLGGEADRPNVPGSCSPPPPRIADRWVITEEERALLDHAYAFAKGRPYIADTRQGVKKSKRFIVEFYEIEEEE